MIARRLRHALLTSAMFVQIAVPDAANASAYMRLQGYGGQNGIGGTGTNGTTGTTGTTGGSDTGTAGGSTTGTGSNTTSNPVTTPPATTTTTTTTTTGTGSGSGRTVTSNPVTSPAAGKITVAQNTDGSITTTTQGTDGTVTKTTKQPDGSATTITTAPSGAVTETTTAPSPSGGNVTTGNPVTVGALDGTGNVTAHPKQAFRAQFTTTSTGTPVWQASSAVPAGVTLSSRTGTLTGALAGVGTYPLQVTDGIVTKPYTANINIIPPLDVADAHMVLRKGTYYQGFYGPQNVVGSAGETLSPLPGGLVFEPWGAVHGTPTDTGFSAATVSVTVQDSGDAGPTGTATRSFPVTYIAQPLTIADYPDLTLSLGNAVNVAAPSTGGTPVNPRFSLQGTLPSGVSLDPATGAISGTPTNVPTVTQLVTVTVGDDTGATATTDPFRVGPAVTGTGDASAEYPVLAEDVYCELAHGYCPVSFETYFTRSGATPLNMFSGVRYTYARPVITDGTIDVQSQDGGSNYALYYNASNSGGYDMEPVLGTVVANQFEFRPGNSNGDAGRTLVRARIGNGGAFPGWEPYLAGPVTVPMPLGASHAVDLAKFMPPTDGKAPFTYLVGALPTGLTFDGAHTLSVAPGSTGILKAQVSVADVAALPTLQQTLTIQAQSNVTAATAYPVSMHGGDEANADWGVGLFYSDAMSTSLSTYATVFTYGQPTLVDGSVDMAGPVSGAVTLTYDNGTGSNGNTDWEPVPASGMTSTRFMLVVGNYSQGAQRLRLGYGGKFPAYLPHLVDARSTAVSAGKPGFVDLAKAIPPVDGTGPFTYTVRTSTDRLDDYPGYTNPRTAPGVANIPGASFDGSHAITFDGSTPQGTYALKVTVSDANGFHSPAANLYVDVQSSVTASVAYPTDIHKGCCYGPDIPTGTAYSENVTRERDDGAYSWYMTFAVPTEVDGTIDYIGDESTPTIYAFQPVIDAYNWVETPQVPVTGTMTASRFRLQDTHDGDGAAQLRLGYAGTFPDFLPTVYATSHNYLIGGSLSIPLSTVMAVRDVKGTASFSQADGTQIPGGTSLDGVAVQGAIADAGPYAPHFAASDSRGFTSRGQAVTLTGTTAADPTYGGQYAMSDYPDASVRAGKAISIAAPTLTGPWVAPRLTLNGTLPAGLAFNADGSITGTPGASLTTASAYTVTATDAYGYNVTTDPFHLVPYGYLTLSDGSLPATYMLPYSGSLPAILSAVGDTDGATWKVTGGSMPLGVALDVRTGALDGVPVHMQADDPMTVQVTSATGVTATAKLDIPVTMWASTFDASSNFVTLPDIATTFGGGSSFGGFTVAAWVNFSDGNCWERIVELAAGGDGYQAIAIGRPSCGFNGLYDSVSGPDGGGNAYTNDGTVSRGTWNYVAMTQSGRTNSIYVNGVIQSTVAQGTPPAVSRPYSWIGRSSFGSDARFGGQMADVQIYNRALSAAELATTQGAGTVPGLVGRYLSTPYQYLDLSGVAGNAVPNGAFTSTPFIPPSITGVGFNPWVYCSGDNGTCSFSGPGQVRYGTTGSYEYLDAVDSQPCNHVAFGGDPAPGVGKSCYVKSTVTPSTGLTATVDYAITLAGYADLGVKRGQVVSTPAPTVGGGAVHPTFAISPTLPTGLGMNANGSISGTMTHSLPAPTTYTVTTHDDRGLSTTATFAMTATDPPSLTGYGNASVAKGSTLSLHPVIGNDPETPTFTVTPPLPAGLALNSDGTVTGTLAQSLAHATAYTITLTDYVQRTATATLTLLPSDPISLSGYADLALAQGDAASDAPSIGGTPNAPAFTVSPALPSGLVLNADGSITGSLASALAQSSDYTVTLTDALGRYATTDLNIGPATTYSTTSAPIGSNNAITISRYPDLIMTVGTPVSVGAPRVGGAVSPLRFAYNGDPLPQGVAFNGDGTITGTPNNLSTAVLRGSVTVTDSRGISATSNTFAQAATGTPIFNDTTIVIDYEGVSPAANIKSLMHAREVNSATQWAVTGGSLPAGQTDPVYLATPQGGGGITMANDGTLSGFGAVTGVYAATITATNLDGVSSSQTLTIYVPMIASYFDGSSNLLQIPSNTTSRFFDASGKFTGYTIGGWVNFQDQGGWERVFEFASGPGNAYGQSLYMDRENGGPFIGYSSYADWNGIQPGQWHHLVETRDPYGLTTLWVDGYSAATSQQNVPDNVDRPLSTFGQSSYPADHLFDGFMCDMVIANRAYSATEVAQMKVGQYVHGEVGRYLNGKTQGYDDSGSGQMLGTWNGPTLYQRFYPQ